MSNLAVIENKSLEKQSRENELMSLIKETYAKGATDEEVKFFAQVCATQNLDPIKRQIYFTKIWDSKQNREVFSPIVSIDGMRSLAEETGLYAGQTTPLFCGEDGIWKEIWTSKQPPFAAKVGVFRKDFKEPVYAIAQFDAYAKRTKAGELTKFWKEMGYHMLAKAAEALALRKALPQRLSGLYSEEERHRDTIDVEFKKEHEDHKPKQIQQEQPKVLDFNIQFQQMSIEVNKIVNKLFLENVGKYDIDKEFIGNFKSDVLHYMQDQFVKKEGKVDFYALFLNKLAATRLNILAIRHNAGREEPLVLNEEQLKDLKKIVYDKFMLNQQENICDIFAKEALLYLPF